MHHLPFHVYTALQSAKDPAKLLRGFEKYINATYNRKQISFEIIAQNDWSLLRYYPAKDQARHSLFIIPSLINGAEIFDLTSTRSFIDEMAQSHVDIYLLEWGDLSAARDLTLDDLLSQSLGYFYGAAVRHTHVPLHVLAYCLGGTLGCHYFSVQADHIPPASLSLLAAPVDFAASDVAWQPLLNNLPRLTTEITARGALTQRMLQSYFMQLSPGYIEDKFGHFLDMNAGSHEEELFIAVEHWLNDGCDLPAQLAHDLIEAYFRQNCVLDYLPDLPHIPVCVITSTKDMIVAQNSADILHQYLSNVTQIHSDCGHIGMMSGRRAQTQVWTPLVKFIEDTAAQQNKDL